MKKKPVLIFFLMFFVLTGVACSGANGKDEGSTFKPIPEMGEAVAEKPVKIKLKRSAEGEYSWELSGDDVENVIETDKRLLLYNKEQKK